MVKKILEDYFVHVYVIKYLDPGACHVYISILVYANNQMQIE